MPPHQVQVHVGQPEVAEAALGSHPDSGRAVRRVPQLASDEQVFALDDALREDGGEGLADLRLVLVDVGAVDVPVARAARRKLGSRRAVGEQSAALHKGMGGCSQSATCLRYRTGRRGAHLPDSCLDSHLQLPLLRFPEQQAGKGGVERTDCVCARSLHRLTQRYQWVFYPKWKMWNWLLH